MPTSLFVLICILNIFILYYIKAIRALFLCYILYGMNEDKNKLDWKPAFDIFGKVSAWVVVPIIFALIIGKALDAHFGTDPWIFLGLTGIAFVFSIYGIVRVVGKYMRTISPDQSRDPDSRSGK